MINGLPKSKNQTVILKQKHVSWCPHASIEQYQYNFSLYSPRSLHYVKISILQGMHSLIIAKMSFVLNIATYKNDKNVRVNKTNKSQHVEFEVYTL